MRRFIYMDSPKIISYLAQANDGHIVKQLFETGDQVSKSTTEPADNISAKYDGALSVGILKGSIGMSGTLHGIETSLVEIQSARELVERAMHDNMYSNLISQISEIGMLSDTPRIGKYFLATDDVRIIDMNMMQEAIRSHTDLIKYNYDASISQLNREQRRNQSLMSKVEKDKPDTEMPKQIEKVMALVNACLPSASISYSDSTIAFIRPEYMREKIQSIYLIDDLRLSMLGFVLNKYKEPAGNTDNGILSNMKFIVKTALKATQSLGVPIGEDVYVLDPIAIYVDESFS